MQHQSIRKLHDDAWAEMQGFCITWNHALATQRHGCVASDDSGASSAASVLGTKGIVAAASNLAQTLCTSSANRGSMAMDKAPVKWQAQSLRQLK